MRILVTGSRVWRDRDTVRRELYRVSEEVFERDCHEKLVLIQGCARGLDEIALGIADGWGWKIEYYAANWEEYGKKAGPLRNTSMIEHGKPDICLAFPLHGSKGTWDMIRKANAAGIEVRIIPPREVGEG